MADYALFGLKILLIFFVVYSLIKFYVFFFIKYERRRKLLDSSYNGKLVQPKYRIYFSSYGVNFIRSPVYIWRNAVYQLYYWTICGNVTYSTVFPQFFKAIENRRITRTTNITYKNNVICNRSKSWKSMEGIGNSYSHIGLGSVYAADSRFWFIIYDIRILKYSTNPRQLKQEENFIFPFIFFKALI